VATAGDSMDVKLRTPPPQSIEWALRAVGAAGRPVTVTAFAAGFVMANHLLRIEPARPGSPAVEIVLRRWVRPEWKQEDPEFSPAQEASNYGLLAGSAVAAPALMAADPNARDCDVPALLLTRAPGIGVHRPADLRSFVRQLAEALPAVHAIDPERARRTLPPYHGYYARPQLLAPEWARNRAVWERAIELGTAPAPAESAAFIHRDYHQGNTLWVRGRMTAIVDWTSAMWGPRSVDLAHMRANLAMSFGLGEADAFLEAYGVAAGAPFRLHPYWDIHDAVDMLPEMPWPGQPAAHRRRLEQFVARAIAELGG
jgi:aminoglycoside phosphotransferase